MCQKVRAQENGIMVLPEGYYETGENNRARFDKEARLLFSVVGK